MVVSLVKYTVEEALAFHENNIAGNGKIEVMSKVPCRDAKDLTLAYTPGVAEPCKAIDKNPELVHRYTSKDNLVAIVTDGTAVLGLGDIGPEAGMPVMEGKAVLFKMLAGVDAFPICLDTKDAEKIIDIVKCLTPTFGGINLEDISAPRGSRVGGGGKRDRLRGRSDGGGRAQRHSGRFPGDDLQGALGEHEPSEGAYS